MSRATFDQAQHLLHLVQQKNLSNMALQLLLSSGIISDLLEAPAADRNRVRAAIGLPAILIDPRRNPGAPEEVTTADVPVVAKYLQLHINHWEKRDDSLAEIGAWCQIDGNIHHPISSRTLPDNELDTYQIIQFRKEVRIPDALKAMEIMQYHPAGIDALLALIQLRIELPLSPMKIISALGAEYETGRDVRDPSIVEAKSVPCYQPRGGYGKGHLGLLPTFIHRDYPQDEDSYDTPSYNDLHVLVW